MTQRPSGSGRDRSDIDFDARSIAAPGEGLGDLYPRIAEHAVACEKWPRLPLARVKPKSNLTFTWRCGRCQKTFDRRVHYVVVKARVLCSNCKPVGKSQFEFEVAFLLRAAAGVEVRTHEGPRHDQVDLYIPSIDTAVELDPYFSHRNKTEHDLRRHRHHEKKFSRVMRVRQEPLTALPGSLPVPARSNAVDWARALTEHLFGPDTWQLSDAAITDALAEAAAWWLDMQHNPPKPALSDDPLVAAEFVKCLSRPGAPAHMIPLGAGVTCEWRCPRGHRNYPARVDHRTGPTRSGCPECGKEATGAARRTPAAGQSMADLVDGSEAAFVRNKERPGVGPKELKPGANDECEWVCRTPECTSVVEATVKEWTRRRGARCDACTRKDSLQLRATNPDDPYQVFWRAALEALDEFIAVNGHAHVPLDHVCGDGFKLGPWVKSVRKRRASLRPEQVAELLARGMEMEPRKARFEAGLAALRDYAAREGHARVPYNYEVGGYRLGLFVAKQRSRYRRDELSPERIATFEAIPGWVWRTKKPRRGTST